MLVVGDEEVEQIDVDVLLLLLGKGDGVKVELDHEVEQWVDGLELLALRGVDLWKGFSGVLLLRLVGIELEELVGFYWLVRVCDEVFEDFKLFFDILGDNSDIFLVFDKHLPDIFENKHFNNFPLNKIPLKIFLFHHFLNLLILAKLQHLPKQQLMQLLQRNKRR